MRPATVLAPAILALAVAACGSSGPATSPGPAGGAASPAAAATAQPTAAAGTPAPAMTAEAPAPAGADPACEQVLTPEELAAISTVDGWKLTQWDDVMPDTDVTCGWDFKLDTPEWLHAEVHLWSDPQAASFLDGGLPGDAVPGLGDAAAWSPIGGRLLVRLGDRVLGLVPGSWLGPDGPEAGAIAMAKLVIPRIPR
jgi:hypothetical protein